MKKSTFIVYLMLISIGLSAQVKIDLKLKIQNIQKKYSGISQQVNMINKVTNHSLRTMDLKSAVVTEKLDSTVNKFFDNESQTWKKDYKDEFVYDGQMRNTGWIAKEWNSNSGLWDLYSKIELGYDGNGQVISMLIYDKDTLTSLLVAASKSNYFYNSSGMPDSVNTYFTENAGATWNLMMKMVHKYNTSKQLIKTESWMYDEDVKAMVLISITDFTYYASGMIKTSNTSYVFEDSEIPSGKSEYFYDTSNRLTSVETYSLNYMTFLLEKSYRDSYQYNSNGDVTVMTYSDWNGTAWVDNYKDEYEYGTKNLSDIAFPYFIAVYGSEDGQTDLKFSKVINSVKSYDMISGSWKQTDVTTFYYSGGTSTGIIELADQDFKIYPNPATESVTFNWKGNSNSFMLKMYQITGAEVLEQNAWPGKGISISHLANGVYFYKLMNGQQVINAGKIVKR